MTTEYSRINPKTLELIQVPVVDDEPQGHGAQLVLVRGTEPDQHGDLAESLDGEAVAGEHACPVEAMKSLLMTGESVEVLLAETDEKDRRIVGGVVVASTTAGIRIKGVYGTRVIPWHSILVIAVDEDR